MRIFEMRSAEASKVEDGNLKRKLCGVWIEKIQEVSEKYKRCQKNKGATMSGSRQEVSEKKRPST
jgi:hypothetical protein